MRAANQKTEVLIVGAGPTGLVLALCLNALNISFRIIDKYTHSPTTSRALVVHARTLELYERLGIAQKIIAKGTKIQHIILKKNYKKIASLVLKKIGKGISPFPYVLSIPQDEHEMVLRKCLQDKGISIEQETILEDFHKKKNTISVLLRRKLGTEILDCFYLCGCDGAHSQIRKTLGLAFKGGTYQNLFYVADVSLKAASSAAVEVNITPASFSLRFPLKNTGHTRLVGMLPESEQLFIDEKHIQDKIEEDGVKIDQIQWSSTYHVHHKMAAAFQLGPFFLLGDAAHIHSPVGGQGMNTGIGDAFNLAWKLAEVLSGKAKKSLLKTYSTERMPFAKKLLATTDQAFELVSSTELLGKFWRNILFPYFLPMLFKIPSLRRYFFKILSQVQINYRKKHALFSLNHTVQVGDRLPWLNEKNIDNYKKMTYDWQLHLYGELTEQHKQRLTSLSVKLIQFPYTKKTAELGFIKQAVYLIRPDGYIGLITQKKDCEAKIKEIQDFFKDI